MRFAYLPATERGQRDECQRHNERDAKQRPAGQSRAVWRDEQCRRQGTNKTGHGESRDRSSHTRCQQYIATVNRPDGGKAVVALHLSA